ncbi:MAG: long-chain fatty acid--CoA ligase [Candidatus Acidiferrales bacterium]|jgi:long-chain acyl-CoA synthetase
MNYSALTVRFLEIVDRLPNPRALLYKQGAAWQGISSQEMLRRVAGLSAALAELGVKSGDRVGLFSANRPEWHIADFAIMGAGGVTVPVYYRESPQRMTHILNHSGAKIAFVAGEAQATALLTHRNDLKYVEQFVVADGGPHLPSDALRYETLIESAGGAEVAAYRLRAAQVVSGQLATIIYTSGTTGEPKGVMLTHENLSSNVTDASADFGFDPDTDVALSFLPLAHVYARTLDYAYLLNGVTLAYVEQAETVAQAMLEVRPTVLAAVPRFLEKFYARVMEQGSRHTGLRRGIFNWAIDVARRAVPWKASGERASALLRMQWWFANKMVYRKVQRGVGGRLRFTFSGGAPLSKELAEFFWAVGVPVHQGYGLTETSPIVSSNHPVNRVGSVGRPIPNVEVKIAADGEVLVKGPCVMKGYYLEAEATREVLSDDGWFKTGDIGHLDADGYLYITDRKKDLLKTAGGKYVAPQPIENALRTSSYISNAVVLGDGRRFVVALIVPNFADVAARAEHSGLTFGSNAQIAAHPWVRRLIEEEVRRLTAHLAQYETIKRFALLAEDFSFDGGSMTFTVKVKRRVIAEKCASLIEQLYADAEEPGPARRDSD